MSKQVALVTGGNKGLGFGTVQALAQKGYHVILGARRSKAGKEAQKKLKSMGLDVELIVLDVSKESSIQKAMKAILKKHKRLDILVNNAGVFLDSNKVGFVSALNTKSKIILDTFKTNTLGAFLLAQKAIPVMQKQGFGRIVNVSSGMGQLDEMEGGCAGYRISKTALNSVTKLLSNEVGNPNVKINCLCPGWVRTDMGGQNAERSIEEGIDTIVWLATLPEDGPNGGFFRDRKVIPW